MITWQQRIKRWCFFHNKYKKNPLFKKIWLKGRKKILLRKFLTRWNWPGKALFVYVIKPEAGSVGSSCELSRMRSSCCWRTFSISLPLRQNNGALFGFACTQDERVVPGAGPAAAVGTGRTDHRCVRTWEVVRERQWRELPGWLLLYVLFPRLSRQTGSSICLTGWRWSWSLALCFPLLLMNPRVTNVSLNCVRNHAVDSVRWWQQGLCPVLVSGDGNGSGVVMAVVVGGSKWWCQW